MADEVKPAPDSSWSQKPLVNPGSKAPDAEHHEEHHDEHHEVDHVEHH